MADTKVSALGSVTPVGTDLLYVVDDPGGTPASAKATISAVMALAPVQSVAGETGAITASALRTAINVADGAEANAVDSVNSQTGVVVLDADDIDDTSTTHKFTTAAEASKLAGIEAGADVTDAANVAAAGAVMDGDFSANGLMERTGAGSYSVTTVTTYAKSLLDDADAAAARTTLGLGTAAAEDAAAFAAAVHSHVLADIADAGTAAATDAADYATAAQGALADTAVQPADLGTAAALDVGTGANAVVQLDETGKLPAVDGSQLTNIGAATGVGDVVGPAGATDSHVALFDGTTGKLLKGGGALGTAAATDAADYATAAQGALADSAVQPADLAAVATSGAYADLSGAPTIPANANDLATEGAALGNITGAATVDCAAGQVFTATVTGAVTVSFTNPNAYDEIVLHLTNGGAAAVTWPAAVDWPGGSAPALTAAGVDLLVFVTADSGTTWRGALAAEDVK
jgi:hypothetical protein